MVGRRRDPRGPQRPSQGASSASRLGQIPRGEVDDGLAGGGEGACDLRGGTDEQHHYRRRIDIVEAMRLLLKKEGRLVELLGRRAPLN